MKPYWEFFILKTSLRNFIPNPLIDSKSELPEDKFSIFFKSIYSI